jgi:acyl-CoA oxidase
MDESHHFLSGFKSLFTDWAYQAIEESRISCGGAGFLKWAGFAEHHNFYSPMQTFEGDNTVMLQQSSRYLFKLIKKHYKGKKVESPFEYIAEIDTVLSDKFICLGASKEHFLNL